MAEDFENNKLAERRNGASDILAPGDGALRPRISSHLANDIPAVRTVWSWVEGWRETVLVVCGWTWHASGSNLAGSSYLGVFASEDYEPD